MPEKRSGKTPWGKYAAKNADDDSTLDFVVRPRFGNRYTKRCPDDNSEKQQPTVLLSTVFSTIDSPAKQAEVLEQLGISVTRNKVRLNLLEFKPRKGDRLHGLSENQSGSSASLNVAKQPRHRRESRSCSLDLQETYQNKHPVTQPMDIRVRYLKDAYIEDDIAFCCLLEANSEYGEFYSIPVLGRGSFSCLGDNSARPGAPADADKREHCVSGASAGFLQRAALSLTVLICLCELSREQEDAVVDFYRRVDKEFGYGYQAYIDYLAYCCRTATEHRHSFLKYFCLEFNNRTTQDRMTSALSHFIETREPTPRFYEEVTKVMTPEELEKDREVHFSFEGQATKASMLIKNARRNGPSCCPCHVM